MEPILYCEQDWTKCIVSLKEEELGLFHVPLNTDISSALQKRCCL